MIRGIMIRKLSILCLSILFCASVAWAADSAGNRGDSIIMLGMAPVGIHLATLVAPPVRVAVILGDITVGIDAGSGSPSYTSTGWTETTGTYTNQGLNARYFFGNSFNASLGYHMRNFSGTTTATAYTLSNYGVTYQIETFTMDAKTSVATIGIGNHWLMDWGLWIGGDWVLASSALSQTKEVTSTGTTGSPSAAQLASFKKNAEAAADEMNAWSASGGFAVLTIGFAF
jgi:hypothetical protein